MDKRYTALPLQQQLELRRQAVQDVLSHPEWTLGEAVTHLKKSMRLTSAEFAKLAGVSFRTLQDIEGGRSEGTVQTMNRIFGVLGLKLGVVRAEAESNPYESPPTA
jgi:transcriptional regulator with XRE-family HTH domain